MQPDGTLAPLLERLLEANRHYADGRGAAPDGPVPSERLVIVTCMDVRIDPLPLLGLELGQAHVLRNAGARLTDDVLRSIVIAQQALGTEAVILMPHTQCGVLGLDTGQLHPRPDVPREIVPPLDFRAMTDLPAALAADLRALRQSPWIPRDVQIHGLILDIETGRVAPPASLGSTGA